MALSMSRVGPASLQSCFGFGVRSPLSFRYLRQGQGEPLEIEVVPLPDEAAIGRLLVEWFPRPDRPFHGKLHLSDAGYQVWIEHFGWYLVNPDEAWIGVPDGVDEIRREEHLWGIPVSLCLLHRGDLPVHAAAVEIDGGAVLLAAPGRFGKTTLAAAFLHAGHRVLTEDLSCLRPGRRITVIPGPAMLRLRRDVLDQFRPREARMVAEFGDRVSFALDGAARGTCDPIPLRAVVLLREGQDVRLDRIGAAEALRELWALSTRIPTEENRRRCFSILGSVAASVPCWWLSRPLRIEELPGVVEVITGLPRGH
jgi:hypothetical protein